MTKQLSEENGLMVNPVPHGDHKTQRSSRYQHFSLSKRRQACVRFRHIQRELSFFFLHEVIDGFVQTEPTCNHEILEIVTNAVSHSEKIPFSVCQKYERYALSTIEQESLYWKNLCKLLPDCVAQGLRQPGAGTRPADMSGPMIKVDIVVSCCFKETFAATNRLFSSPWHCILIQYNRQKGVECALGKCMTSSSQILNLNLDINPLHLYAKSLHSKATDEASARFSHSGSTGNWFASVIHPSIDKRGRKRNDADSARSPLEVDRVLRVSISFRWFGRIGTPYEPGTEKNRSNLNASSSKLSLQQTKRTVQLIRPVTTVPIPRLLISRCKSAPKSIGHLQAELKETICILH